MSIDTKCNSMEDKKMRIKLGIHLILIYIFMFFIGMGSYAYFNSQSPVNNNTFTAGTLTLAVGTKESNSLIFPAAKWIPGIAVNKNFTIENTGTLPFQYSISAEMIEGDQRLFDIIQASIFREDGTQICKDVPLKRLQIQKISDNLMQQETENLKISMVIPPENIDKGYQDLAVKIKLHFNAVQN